MLNAAMTRHPMHRLLLVLLLLALGTGCGHRLRPIDKPVGSARERALTPTQYQMLKDDEKIRYKDVVVRVPASWGGALLPFDPGPYPSAVDKAVHGGDLSTLMGLYNQSL